MAVHEGSDSAREYYCSACGEETVERSGQKSVAEEVDQKQIEREFGGAVAPGAAIRVEWSVRAWKRAALEIVRQPGGMLSDEREESFAVN
jgi:hypothetical protein